MRSDLTLLSSNSSVFESLLVSIRLETEVLPFVEDCPSSVRFCRFVSEVSFFGVWFAFGLEF